MTKKKCCDGFGCKQCLDCDNKGVNNPPMNTKFKRTLFYTKRIVPQSQRTRQQPLDYLKRSAVSDTRFHKRLCYVDSMPHGYFKVPEGEPSNTRRL